MGKSVACAAVLAPRNEPIRKAPEDAFARAVEIVGSERTLADRTSIPLDGIHEVLWSGTVLDPDFCPEVERAARLKVTCEELRPDLIWHRDGAGEVVGYSCAIDNPREVLAAALAPRAPATPSPLVDGKWDALSYRAGILHGVDQSYVDELLNGVYSGDRDWTDPNTLEGLRADVEDWHSTGAYLEAYGMLHDLDEATRERLLAESGISLSREWTQEKSDALWAKAQAIRATKPYTSSIAGKAFAEGIASVLAKYGKDDDFRDFYGLDKKKEWDSDDFRMMADHALTILLDSVLGGEIKSWASWENILIGQAYHLRSQIGSGTAERVGKTAENLLDIIVPGLEAVHDYQFSVLTSNREDTLDAASPVRLCGFQMCMQELVGLLINLRGNMLFQQRELEA